MDEKCLTNRDLGLENCYNLWWKAKTSKFIEK